MIKLGGKSSIVIEIKDDFIDIIVGNSKNIRFEDSINIEPGICEDGFIKDLGKVSKILTTYFMNNKIDEKEVSFVVFGSDIITRYLELPYMKGETLKKTLDFEIKEIVQNSEDYYIDYEVINHKNNNSRVEVLVAACLKTKIDAIVSLSQGINKKLKVIDVLTNTINKVLLNSDIVYKNESIATFYFGYSFSNISIASDGILKLERSIPFGFKNLYKEFQRIKFEEQNKEIEKIDNKFLKEFELETNNINEFFSIYPKIEESVIQLLNIVHRTINFYGSGKGKKIVNKILVISTMKLSNTAVKYIEDYFNTETLLIREADEIGLKVRGINNNFGKCIPLYGLFLRRN